MIIRLVNDALIPDADFAKIVSAVKYFTKLTANAWNIPTVVVEVGNTPDASDWMVYVTDKNRHVGAAGYHTVVNGIPVAYCSPKASGRLFGTYIKPLVIRGKQIHGGLTTPGLVSTICHEIAEMLVDPVIQNFSAKDSQGRSWLVEVCDHCFGSYMVYVADGTKCIIPDVTTPSYYDLNGSAPYTIFGAVDAPFKLTPKGYAYYKDASGKLVKVV